MANKYNNNSNNSEITERLVNISRCSKVVKGGRKFSFSVIVVVGDRKGRVGHGLGKASEVMDAKASASKEAKRRMVKIPLREGRTLHHDVIGKFCSGKVVMRAAPSGTGVIAGGAVRAVFDVLGIKDVVVKSLGSNNPHNMIKAAFEGLQKIKTPKMIAEKRGKKVAEITSYIE
jgi:small subunit ribosomal protein S5